MILIFHLYTCLNKANSITILKERFVLRVDCLYLIRMIEIVGLNPQTKIKIEVETNINLVENRTTQAQIRQDLNQLTIMVSEVRTTSEPS